MLFPFLQGYPKLGELLEAMPPDAWRRDEAVLVALIIYLLKHGQSSRAKSYLRATNLEFDKTYIFEFADLLLGLHLGETVSDRKLTIWRRLERSIPVTQPLMLGLYHNSMMAMYVRLLRPEDARLAGQQAMSCYREAGHAYLEHFIHIHLADLDVMEGRLSRARRGLTTAERCLEESGVRYGNEEEVIAVIRLAIDYECGRFDRVCQDAARLRMSLLNGDSWSELFLQLARITAMSTYFLKGHQAAVRELEIFQADYTRRHSGTPHTFDVFHALLCNLEWHPNRAQRHLDAANTSKLHSATGEVLRQELMVSLGLEAAAKPDSPRSAIVAALHNAQFSRGSTRKQFIEKAMMLAFENGQISLFMEHRDIFLGVSAKLSSTPGIRKNPRLARMTRQVLRLMEESYVVPPKLKEIGFNRRQYRVAAALQSGSTNKQVARQLGTSEATVKYHLTSLYRLAGVRRRGEFIDFINELEVFQNS